jgi:hypothetical protein
MDVESTWIPTWYRMGHVSWSLFWTIFTNHLSEVGLTQNRETMALWTLITVGLFYFIMCEDLHEYKSIEITFDWGSGYILLYTTLWRFVTTLHDFGGILGRPLDTFFWALIISWSRLSARVWSGPKHVVFGLCMNNLTIFETVGILYVCPSLCLSSNLKSCSSSTRIYRGCFWVRVTIARWRLPNINKVLIGVRKTCPKWTLVWRWSIFISNTRSLEIFANVCGRREWNSNIKFGAWETFLWFSEHKILLPIN